MTTYYLDTSALSKQYVQEIGTEWIRALAAKDEHTLLTARVTMVEVYSALARRKREGSVPPADCDIFLSRQMTVSTLLLPPKDSPWTTPTVVDAGAASRASNVTYSIGSATILTLQLTLAARYL